MNKYYFMAVTIFLVLSISCGKAPVPTEKKSKLEIIKNKSQQDILNKSESKLVDADEFSKAFSQSVRQIDEGAVEKKVDDGSLFFKSGALVQNRFSNQEFQESVPPKLSMAAEVGCSKKFSWLPNWSFSGKGGVRIPYGVISDDKSLIALLDNVSSEEGKTSTLIVLINTYNFEINAIYYFPGKFFSKIKFLSSSSLAVLWEKNQDIKNSGNLHTVNLQTGKIIASSKPVSSSKVNFAINGNDKKLILKTGNRKKTLYLFDLENLDQMPKSIECDQEEGAVAVSKDSSLFALAGRKKIEIFKFSDNMKFKDIKIELKAIPDDFMFIDNNIFALLSYMQPFYLVADDTAKELCALAGRRLFFRDDIKAIIFEEYKNKAISMIDLKSLRNLDSFSPEKLKPKTQGGAVLLTYLPHLKKYMLLDDQGNLSLFYRPGKRWRKNLIFSAEKSKNLH